MLLFFPNLWPQLIDTLMKDCKWDALKMFTPNLIFNFCYTWDMHFVIFHFYSWFFWNFMEISDFFQWWKINLYSLKEKISEGIDTSVSVAGSLSPSFFCWKMERICPGREEKIGKGVKFPAESAFPFWTFSDGSPFPYFYLDLTCEHLCFPLSKM